MHKFYSASRYYVNMTLTLTHCSFANGPHYGHWNQALNRDARKVRSLRKAYRRFYAVIFATSRQSHRSRFRARRFSFCTVSTCLSTGKEIITMILDEDLYPPRHKTVVKFRTTTQQSTQNSSSLSPQHDHTWLDGLNSPLIQDEGDSKMLKLRFDVSQYTPEEIVVKTVDNKLLVHAKHEEKTESKSVYREYNREFLLPKGTNPESIKSSLSKDGVLTVEAPLPAIGSGEKLIPIAHQ